MSKKSISGVLKDSMPIKQTDNEVAIPHGDDQLCLSCRQLMCPVPMDRSNGSTTYSYECANAQCPNGPSGWCIIRVRSKDDKITSDTEFSWTGIFAHMAEGAPLKNEANVEPVARAFMSAVNRQYGTLFDRYIRGPKNAQAERGYDCEIASSQEEHSLKIQVTRALPPDIYRDQAIRHKQGISPARQIPEAIDQAADWIMEAIRRKKTRAAPDIVLVVDGQDAPFLAFLTDVIVLKANEVELKQQKWHSIWVIGPTGARWLSGRNFRELTYAI